MVAPSCFGGCLFRLLTPSLLPALQDASAQKGRATGSKNFTRTMDRLLLERVSGPAGRLTALECNRLYYKYPSYASKFRPGRATICQGARRVHYPSDVLELAQALAARPAMLPAATFCGLLNVWMPRPATGHQIYRRLHKTVALPTGICGVGATRLSASEATALLTPAEVAPFRRGALTWEAKQQIRADVQAAWKKK